MTLHRCAIVDVNTNLVVNLIEYETIPVGEAPGLPGCIAIETAEAQIGWSWDGQAFQSNDPPPEEAPPQD